MKIKVLVCRAGEEPVLEEIERELESYQAIVGGLIEPLTLAEEDGHTVDLFMNEEATILSLTPNLIIQARAPAMPDGFDFIIKSDEDLADPGQVGFHYIRGDLFISRTDQESGEMVDLTKEDVEKYSRLLKLRAKAEDHDKIYPIRILSLIEADA